MIRQRDHAHLATWKCWTVAFVATAASTVLQMIYLRIEGNCALIPPIAAVMLTASVAGLRPSLATLVLNLIIAEYIVIPPYYSFALQFVKGVIPLMTLIVFASLSWYSALSQLSSGWFEALVMYPVRKSVDWLEPLPPPD